MCTCAESRGMVDGDLVISKVAERDYDEDRMRSREGGEGARKNNGSDRFIQGLLHLLTALFPSLSLSEMLNQAGPQILGAWANQENNASVKEELKSLAKISCPMMMTNVLLYSRSAISMLFLGRQGKVELAGGALAIGFANITANSLLKGLTMGMEPICSQAYGAKRWSILSQTFFKTLFLLLIVTIPISLLWLNMSPLLQWLGQDPEVTKIAQVYLVYSIPELLAQAHLNPLRSFIRTQGLTSPLTISASFAAILHLPINYFLANYLKLGVKGIALATGLNSINMILGLLLYLVLSKKALKPWEGATILSTFDGWKPLLSLALPSCISVCLEWWCYEIMLFLCGLLSNPQATVATMGVLIQTTGFLYVFPFSLSAALTIRVGHSLGAGEPSKAQSTAIIGLFIAFTFGVSAFVLLVSIRKIWGKLFTNETQIVDMVTTILPILGLCEVGNWPQTAACGILTGTARPYVGVRINLCAFYLIGLPVAIFSAFMCTYQLRGLWFGMLAAQVSCFCMMVYTLIQTDWGQQTKRAEQLAMKTLEEDGVKDEECGLLNSDL